MTPPRWAERLVDHALPRDPWGDGIRGDLREELAERARRGSATSARRWYAWQCLTILVWASADRLVGRRWGRPARAVDPGSRRASVIGSWRIARRTLRRAPGYATAVIATLGLSMALATAVFSVVHGVLVAPLPLPAPADLVRLDRIGSDGVVNRGSVAYPDLIDWRAQITSLDDIAGITGEELIHSADGMAEVWTGLAVTPNFLTVLRVPPAVGAIPSGFPVDTQPGARRILLGHHIWRSRFGGDPALVGRTIEASGERWTVDGVLPPDFTWELRPDFIVPLPAYGFLDRRGTGFLRTVARLAAGRELEAARAEVTRVAGAIDAQSGEWGHGVSLRRVHDVEVAAVRRPLLVLMGAVALVLLVACANVAAMTQARLEGRRPELAVRGSLGAGRGRLFLELLAESVWLSIAGGLLGLVLTWLGLHAVLALLPADVPHANAIDVGPAVIGFAAVAALVAGILSGAVPALRASRVRGAEALRASERVVGRGRRMQEVLGGVQIVVAVVLVFGAGLLGRSFLSLASVDPGFRTDDVLVMEIGLDASRYAGRQAILDFQRALLESVETLDGVTTAALSSHLPFSPSNISATIAREGEPFRPGQHPELQLEFVNGPYFETLGLPLRRGRDLDFTAAGEPRQILINETAAAALWPGQDPIGKRLSFDVEQDALSPESSYFRVVGVVGDALKRALNDDPVPIGYYAFPDVSRYYTFISGRFFYLTVHAAGRDPLTLAAPVRRVLGDLDPTAPPRLISSLGDLVATTTRPARFVASVVGVFGLLALVVSSIGLYGVMAHGVMRSLPEIGVRMALGEPRWSVQARVLARAARIVLPASLAGTGIALAAGSVLRSFLFGITPRDPATLAVVLALVLLGGLAAALAPAHLASRTDLVRVLRG